MCPVSNRPTIFCPAHIEFLIHCNMRPHLVFDRIDAPAFVELARQWTELGVIRKATDVPHWDRRRFITPLGRAWLQAIENVQLPRAVFLDEQGREL